MTTTITAVASRRAVRRAVGALIGCALTLAWVSQAQAAPLGIRAFDARLSTQQAGAHPDLTVKVDFDRDPANQLNPTQSVKRLQVDLPSGIMGDLTAVPQCEPSALFNPTAANCPSAAQVGTADLTISGRTGTFRSGVYSMRPADPEAETAWLALPIAPAIFNSYLRVAVRSDGDHGLRAELARMTAAATLTSVEMRLWGVPAHPVHDPDRRHWPSTCTVPNCPPTVPPSPLAPRPFLSNPTSCGRPMVVTARATSFEDPNTWVEPRTGPANVGQITGCERVPFQPKVEVQAGSRQAGAPGSHDVRLRVPQTRDPLLLSSANLRRAEIRLPDGVVLNPAAALGLGTCSDEALGLGSTDAAKCPNDSKLGSVEIDAPIVGGTLEGGIYLRPSLPDKLLRLAIVADGFGVHLKFPGDVTPDPATGRLTNVFEDLPQLPFEELRVRFKGGDRAPLTNPRGCGTHTSEADLTPWSGQPTAKVSSSTTIDEDCGPAPFSPSFEAGMAAPVAGESSPFVLTVERGPREPEITTVALSLPPGITGLVGSVPLCPQVAAAMGSCGPESRVGSVTARAGAGHEQVQLAGTAYLTEGYGGAPFGLVFVVPAKAGPFDLGLVVVRSRIFVNRLDATLSVDSEALPTILQGIPLNVRALQIALDRPGFMLAPTNCDPMQINGAVGGAGGASVARSSRFQVGGCDGKRFDLDFGAESSGRANRRNGASLRVHLGARPGNANVRSVQVTLPREIGPRLETINKACVIGDFERGACSRAARVGSASATTPVLRTALRGPVDLVVVPGQLPTLRVQLRGDVPVDLVGDVQISRGGATTTFRSVPDIPITSFDLDLPMGPSSLLTPSKALCGERIRMPAQLTSQAGRTIKRSVPVALRDCAVRVMRTTAGKRSVSVSVAAPGAGRLTVSGKGVRSTRKTVRGQGAAMLTVPLTRAARNTVARGRRLRLRLKVAYRPSRGAQARASSASTTVSIRPPRRR